MEQTADLNLKRQQWFRLRKFRAKRGALDFGEVVSLLAHTLSQFVKISDTWVKFETIVSAPARVLVRLDDFPTDCLTKPLKIRVNFSCLNSDEFNPIYFFGSLDTHGGYPIFPIVPIWFELT